MDRPERFFGLLRCRQVYVPTWRGMLVVALSGFACLWVLVHFLPGFLGVERPVPARTLVVEGWASDVAFEFVTNHIRQSGYERIVVTGGPIDTGAPLSEYRTYAERGAAILLAMGCSSNLVQAVPAPRVRQDRTYTAAVALRRWMQIKAIPDQSLNLVTVGPHARRSRLLYSRAFGGQAAIGTFVLPAEDFDERRWYASSAGFRTVVGETLAYTYAKLLFHPADPVLSFPGK